MANSHSQRGAHPHSDFLKDTQKQNKNVKRKQKSKDPDKPTQTQKEAQRAFKQLTLRSSFENFSLSLRLPLFLHFPSVASPSFLYFALTTSFSFTVAACPQPSSTQIRRFPCKPRTAFLVVPDTSRVTMLWPGPSDCLEDLMTQSRPRSRFGALSVND